MLSKDYPYICTLKTADSVAQLVEQYTFNVWALGSNPSGITKGVHFGTKRTFLFSTNKACFNENGKQKRPSLVKQGGLYAWNESISRKTSLLVIPTVHFHE